MERGGRRAWRMGKRELVERLRRRGRASWWSVGGEWDRASWWSLRGGGGERAGGAWRGDGGAWGGGGERES